PNPTRGSILFIGPLLFLSMSCSPPLHMVWDDHQPVLHPQEPQALPESQGLLVVYSERYDKPIAFDEGPTLVRRPIQLHDDEGQFLEELNFNPMNDDPTS